MRMENKNMHTVNIRPLLVQKVKLHKLILKKININFKEDNFTNIAKNIYHSVWGFLMYLLKCIDIK